MVCLLMLTGLCFWKKDTSTPKNYIIVKTLVGWKKIYSAEGLSNEFIDKKHDYFPWNYQQVLITMPTLTNMLEIY